MHCCCILLHFELYKNLKQGFEKLGGRWLESRKQLYEMFHFRMLNFIDFFSFIKQKYAARSDSDQPSSSIFPSKYSFKYGAQILLTHFLCSDLNPSSVCHLCDIQFLIL